MSQTCVICGVEISGTINRSDIPVTCPRCFREDSWEIQFIKAKIIAKLNGVFIRGVTELK
jgi:hypothetical protein